MAHDTDHELVRMPPLHNAVMPGRRVGYWLVLAILFAIFGGLSTPQKTQTFTRYDDAALTQDGTWKVLELGRYNQGHAIFTSEPGAEVTVKMKQPGTIQRVHLRLWSYKGGMHNTLDFIAGEQAIALQYGGEEVGLINHTLELSGDDVVDSLKVRLGALGQPSWVLDSITVEFANQIDWARIALRIAVFGALGLAIWFAAAFTMVPKASSGRIYESIDVFRGIGALLVVLLHATGYAGLPEFSGQDWLKSITKQGHYGVEIFYVVSAYTLSFSLASALQKKSKNKLSIFWNRRVNRIIPVFLFCILATLALKGMLDSNWGKEPVLPVIWRYLTMTYIFDREVLSTAISHTVWWSISTEFQFYVLMPLVFFPLIAGYMGLKERKPIWQAGIILALLLGSVILVPYMRLQLSDKAWLPYTLFYHLDAFVVGVCLALGTMGLRNGDTKQADPQTGSALWAGLSLACYATLLICVACSDLVQDWLQLPRHFAASRLFVIIVCAACIYFARLCEQRGATLKNLTWLRTLGLLSFIIYLIHVPVLQCIRAIPVPTAIGTDGDYYAWILCLGLIVSIILSVVIHHVIERPSLSLNRLAGTYPVLRTATNIFIGVVLASFILALAIG